MIHGQNFKIVSITQPNAIVDATGFVTTAVDLTGWDQCTIVCFFGPIDIAMTALKVQTSDNNSSYSDVTGLVYGTSTNSAGSTSSLPSASADETFFAFHIDARKVKKYVDLVASGGDGSAGTYMTAFAILTRGETEPSTAALRGFAQELIK